MAEQKNKLPSGAYETPSETVARAKAQLESLNAGKKKNDATTDYVVNNSGTPTGSKNSAVLEALTKRLTEQGKGISSSSSSALQDSINEAISGAERSGDLTRQRLQSEREREVSFAQDRASATYTSALEGRSGYATQTAAFRELTETTEKSVRDLDKRYQELILAGDAETASMVAGLRMKKLEFQQQQEQNYFSNLISLGGLVNQENQMLQAAEQFRIDQQNQQTRFVAQMAQSNYQFEKNLGIELKQLELQSQELDIARQRNAIEASRYNQEKAAINAAFARGNAAAKIFQDIRRQVQERGQNPADIDVASYAENYGWSTYGGTYEGASLEDITSLAEVAKQNLIDMKVMPPVQETTRTGGLLNQGGALRDFGSYMAQPYVWGYEQLFGTKQ